MTLKTSLIAGIVLMLSACTLLPQSSVPRVRQSEPAAPGLINELARVSAFSAEQRQHSIADLEGARLDDARRFQLAALLERDDSAESLERSLKTLSAMGELDTRSQALVDLMKRSLKTRLENRQLAARNAELQDKLDQIKALEKSLQQRNVPGKTP